jgi:hypothetical protein
MNNYQAIGYMLLACKDLNLDKETVTRLRSAMFNQFDMKTESEAQELGQNYFNEEIDIISPESSLQGNHHHKAKSEQRLALEAEFERLWALYPRRMGKLTAQKAFIKARKKGATFGQIEAGLKDYLEYISLNRVDTAFIKHGSSWFHNHGWEDDYSQ